MTDQSGKLTTVFNGEIYNFLELREELETLGHVFRTKGDTEVILAAYRQWGTAGIARLDGMFAFALWDESRRELVLARDRTGKKPLFVYEDDKRLLVASEIKALLVHEDLDLRENPEAPALFLTYGYVPTPATFYRRIRSMLPGTFERHAETGGSRAETYWDFAVGPSRSLTTTRDVDEAAAEIRGLFFQAVRRRLIADVPVGAFLSGGVDSTLVVAAMAQHSTQPIKTFSIGFEGHPSWDETEFARLVAKRYRTDHTEFKVRPESFGAIDSLAWFFDQPFADASCIPTFIVSQLTRARVTVALTGDGGDEIFAGYSRFLGASVGEHLPRLARWVLGNAANVLPTPMKYGSLLARTKRAALALSRDLGGRLRSWMSFFTPTELRALLTPEAARYVNESTIGESYDRALRSASERGADVVNQVLYANAKTYLLDDLNVKTDRSSMAVGLETRSPFLDTALMDFSFSLPGNVKLRGKTTKWLLKRALNDLLPPEVLSRPKMGFGVPLGAWFRSELTEELTRERSAAFSAVVRPDALARLLEQHRGGARDLGPQLFALKMLELFVSRSVQERAGAGRNP